MGPSLKTFSTVFPDSLWARWRILPEEGQKAASSGWPSLQ
jgi:hypothetical protein